MEAPPILQARLRGAKEASDTSSTQEEAPVKHRDHPLPSLPKIPHRPRIKQRDHRLLSPLQIPRLTNHFPLQLPSSGQSALSLAAHQTKYRQYSGEVYESAQVPTPREASKESVFSISDPNFLQLIRAAVSSGETLTLHGDQSRASSDSSRTDLEILPEAFVFDSSQDNSQVYIVDNLSLRLGWTVQTMFSTLKESQWGDPVNPAEHGLLSAFKEKFPVDEGASKLGQKIWDDGFDIEIFMLSNRVDHSSRKHLCPLVPYKLRGTRSAAKEYAAANGVYLRRKKAWIELCNALDSRSANERLSKEFEEVATDFFSGRPVEAEYGDGNAKFSTTPKPYHLTFREGDRTKVLEEYPLASQTLALFLEDLVMANEMEKARVTNGTYQNSLKVCRHQSHGDTFTKLQGARESQENYTWHDLNKGESTSFTRNSDLNEALVAFVKNMPDEGTDKSFSVLEMTKDDSKAKLYKSVEALDVPGHNSTLNYVSPEQSSTTEGASTTLGDISTVSPGPIVNKQLSSIYDSSTSPSRIVAPTVEVATQGNNSNGLSGFSKGQGQADACLQAVPKTDKGNVAEVEITNSTTYVESSSSKKKKRGSKRQPGNKGNGAKNAPATASSQDNQDSDHATVSSQQLSKTSPGLGIEAETETRTHSSPENAAISDDDNEWNEVKTKVSTNSKSSKKDSFQAPPKTVHSTPPSKEAEASNLREFKPEECPSIFSATPTVKPTTDDQATGVVLASNHVASLPVIQNISWEDTVRNLPPEEAEAIRILSNESQHSTTPSGPRLKGHTDASVIDIRTPLSECHPIDELITARGKALDEDVDGAPATQNTGLEWAAAELTSPTKFHSGWRHSSLPYRSTTPSQDGFDDSVEILTTRRRSNTTTILDPRVRAVQFGDFPVALHELTEDESAAGSAHSDSLSYGILEEASAPHEQGAYPGSVPVFTGNFPPTASFLDHVPMPVAAQMPIAQPPMFMPPPYPPRGFFPRGPSYHPSHSHPPVAPYGLPVPGFAYPPPPMSSYPSGYVPNHAYLVPITYNYPPNTSTASSIPSYNYQPVGQASQQDGDHDESFTGQSRSDDSFEPSSNTGQQPGPSTDGQDTTMQIGYRCSCCFQGGVASLEQPLYFCGGCGPTCAIRYCSAACLLADSYSHSLRCMQYPHYKRMDAHNMPEDLYEYERFYLAPVELRTEKETPERFRQRAFAMYCWQGPFPRILKAFSEHHELPVGLTGCDVNESFKKTGDYHIFRSEVSAEGKKFAPVEVICTLRLRDGDPMKEALNRALNACLLYLQPRVVKFLFRLLRHLILDLDAWSLMIPVLDQRTVHAEFIHQFSREFSFDAQAYAEDIDTFDLNADWNLIRLDMQDLEMQFQVLRCWFRTKRQFISAPLEPRDAYQ